MGTATGVYERDTLLRHLDSQRNHVLGILDGLPDHELRRSVLPSGWSPAGLVQHLTLDVERFWFRAVVAGEQDVIASLEEASNAWEIASDGLARDVFDLYRQEIDRANTIINSTPLEAPLSWWPDFFGDYRLRDLREVILHVITETACHAGHLDAARELMDGRKWLVLTE